MAAIAVLVVGSAYWGRRTERDGTRVIQLSNPRQVTFTSSVETNPTWSPDGGRIAYVSDQSGNEDIWVSPAAGGSAVNFTADHPGSDYEPSWSPDGNQIAFVSDRDEGGHLRDAGNRRTSAPDFAARLLGRGAQPAVVGRRDRIGPHAQGSVWKRDRNRLAGDAAVATVADSR